MGFKKWFVEVHGISWEFMGVHGILWEFILVTSGLNYKINVENPWFHVRNEWSTYGFASPHLRLQGRATIFFTANIWESDLWDKNWCGYTMIHAYNLWLVVLTILKNMKVNGKDYSIYDGKKCSKPPTIYIYNTI
jgi:hypothetical protein